MSKVVEITDRNFEEEILNSDLPTEVDFWAPWCVPCRMVSPIYDKLSEEYDGRFKFCKLNVDENQQTAAKYQVMSIPMQMYFVDGQKVNEILGAVPEPNIRNIVESIFRDYPTDEKGRLKVILNSWIQHNKKYSKKFNMWMQKTDNIEDNAIYRSILDTVREMEKTNDNFSRLLSELK
ncbi:MAG: thioredoxin [Candidatus Atribacteria bacterium]|nr:thioredoxin [Candidatus Atribacteria bacterium]